MQFTKFQARIANLMCVIVLLSFLACGAPMYYLEGGGHRAVKPDYRLKGVVLPSNTYTIIDTNAIYLGVCVNCGEKGVDIYDAIRFFSDGRVYSSFLCDTKEELLENCNNPNETGSIGYFVLKDNKLTIETFSSNHYSENEYKVQNDTLINTKSKHRDGSWFALESPHIKIKMNDLKGSANW